MRVAVVGAGLFGSTAALILSRAGHDVHLYEAKSAPMQGATAYSFNRLHRGYHYPRAPETGAESRAAEASFRAEYGESVLDNGRQLYLVPEDDKNHVTPDSYHTFLANEGLRFYRTGNVFRVVEPRLDIAHLQRQVRAKLDVSAVKLHLNTVPDLVSLVRDFDQVVLATYAGLNQNLAELGMPVTPYRYQVVERPLVFLPADFHGTSIVVIDGPYGCLDPLDNSTMHMLGHVTETIHAETTSFLPWVPRALADFIGCGMVPSTDLEGITKFDKVISSLSKWVANLDQAEHIGSTFVVRAVQAYVESTDQRPTLVERLNAQVIRLFSGKLGTAVQAANQVLRTVENAAPLAAPQAADYEFSHADLLPLAHRSRH